ncbi:MAG TPA: AsmA family protein [Ramlibacter sp.]|jgi:uncharacterized protein involved in outer membrane biogenesis|uniref:AsmA family protein n=1 Tax=Ramlibacter sp. TaxID=1917967 RepID=UPI002D2F7EBD|nr:AsmA family protein [Ramlibacter sp.]HZY17628.1 AsmA family protein [Ramlibacter sp.]
MADAAVHPAKRLPWWAKLLAAIVLVLAALMLLVALFPWDVLRGPINRYVSEKTGRHFEITRRLDVKVGRTTRVLMDGIEFANPDWARDRHLVKADAAEVDVRLWPLLRRRIELPLIRLTRPQLGMQIEPDGRKTWALGGDTKDESNVPDIGALVVDQGTLHYVASAQGADVRVDFAMDRATANAGAAAGTPAMPLQFQARGTWQEQAFTAQGRTGDVLYLSAPLQQPFPAEVQLAAGNTRLEARGAVSSLATLDGANVDFRLQGNNLGDLYKLVGVSLPDTPKYAMGGQLAKEGNLWRARRIDARLGRTDITGELAFDQSAKVPALSGQLKSRMLDFEDLAPLIGLRDDPKGRSAAATQKVADAGTPAAKKDRKDKAPKDPNRKVLPNAPLDVSRIKSMNADVQVEAAKVVNAKGLPLDSMRTHVRLADGVLRLDPLDLGVAGGRLAGQIRIDANANPATAQTRLDARSLELSKLVPASQSMRNSFGKLQAQIELTTRGGSVAQMLGNADGNVALLMGRGEISNILLEFAGLDGGEVLKFFVEGDRRVEVRCAATAFNVEKGVMTSRALLLDTDDTVFWGNARIDLGREAMDVVIKPQPKDTSILSLRSPLKVGGTFGAPEVGLDKGSLAGRALAAVALGAVNPLLALAATIETGPGQDADCVGTLRQAAAPASNGKPTEEDRQRMGAAPAAPRR